MPRETKAEFAARVAADNQFAARIAPGSTNEDPLLGTVTLLSKHEELSARPESQGWDIYVVAFYEPAVGEVLNHHWSSACVRASETWKVSS